MKLYRTFILILIGLIISHHSQSQTDSLIYDSASLKIIEVSENAFVHISFLDTKDYGKVACNGMLVINDKEAVVLETPVDDQVSEELINWIEKEHQATINAVIVHHFHVDCLGGLKAFHQRNIPSYSHEMTIELAGQRGNELPLLSIEQGQQTLVGDHIISSHYFGPAHTDDNIVSYYENENILFGGCMIKSLGAKEGNLADANVPEWSQTLAKLKTELSEIQLVIPGHGKEGGSELLDYTIKLFGKY